MSTDSYNILGLAGFSLSLVSPFSLFSLKWTLPLFVSWWPGGHLGFLASLFLLSLAAVMMCAAVCFQKLRAFAIAGVIIGFFGAAHAGWIFLIVGLAELAH